MSGPSIGLLGAWRRWFRPQPPKLCRCEHPSYQHDLTLMWGGIGACNLCKCRKYKP